MSLFGEAARSAARRRNVFFSFHYDDVMRVNNVRKSGQFKTEEGRSGRNVQGFYDRSLWEKKKAEGSDAIKRMIRDGIVNTSAVCVLIGSKTWQRPWVRYEIARSVIDGRGLLAVHINGLNHHLAPFQAHPLGENPCRYLGLAKANDGKIRLCERVQVDGAYEWRWYRDYVQVVDLPTYMPEPVAGRPLRLSEYVPVYDYVAGGHERIGGWIDAAAQAVGR